MKTTRWIPAAVLAVACTVFPAARAQGPAAITGIAHVAVRVSDLDKEVNFLGKLGFEEAFANTSGATTLLVQVKVNDRQFIEVYPQTTPPQPLGWMHVCYEADDVNNLNAMYKSNGLNPTAVAKTVSGNLIFSLAGPEGRVSEFMQYMPGSRHALDRGQHLGENRIAGSLLGLNLPVADVPAARQFYVRLGFSAEDSEGTVHLTAPDAADLRIDLHPAGPHQAAQVLLPVADARKAADVLRHAGLAVDKEDKLVFVNDPDGNAFVLIQTGPGEGLLHKVPFVH